MWAFVDEIIRGGLQGRHLCAGSSFRKKYVSLYMWWIKGNNMGLLSFRLRQPEAYSTCFTNASLPTSPNPAQYVFTPLRPLDRSLQFPGLHHNP